MAATAIIKLRRATAAAWTAAGTTVLAVGEIAYETDTRAIKVGDGGTVWTSLPYVLYGVGKTWTPTVTQSTNVPVATTGALSSFSRVGRRVLGGTLVTVSAGTSGVSGVAIVVSLPVTGAHTGQLVGTATWTDPGNGYWTGNLIALSGGTTASIYGSYAANGGLGFIGTSNATALVPNDTIAMQFNYEVSAD